MVLTQPNLWHYIVSVCSINNYYRTIIGSTELKALKRSQPLIVYTDCFLCLLKFYIFYDHYSYYYIVCTYSTGQAGWGIAWYINGTLVPELVVERGRTYTFLVHGGDNPDDDSNYHPFYITDSRNGGRLLNEPNERKVSIVIEM